jgi:hypothetical protein
VSIQCRISAAIAGIYDSALDRAEWQVTLGQLAELLGGTAVSLKLDSADSRHVIASDGLREDAKSEYQNYYRQ